MRWYITETAIREYQRIADNPPHAVALTELLYICDGAELKKAAGEGNCQAAIYQATAMIDGRRARLELYVAEYPRPEGDLPQLVRVRLKRRGGKRR